MRLRYLRCGATDQEVGCSLPGDDLIPNADMNATRAITIRAAADHVWPWIAQLGQGRGGFYSYDRLENLVGCNIHSSDRILLELQDIKVGDEIRLAPQVGLLVALVEQGRSLVLRGGIPMGKWARLIVEPTELLSFVMSQKMLRGIRDRAERTAATMSEASGASERAESDPAVVRVAAAAS
jgi:hypothetical protein